MTEAIIVPIAFFMTVIVLGIGIPLVRAYVRRSELRAQRPAVSADADARLARIEAAVEAIAIEVERVSEGQRFTTRLLAEHGTAVATRASSADHAESAGEFCATPHEKVR